MLLSFISMAQQAAERSFVDTAAGFSGWTAAGLLGAVLLWFGKVYLPAKDKQAADHFAALLAQNQALIERKDMQSKEKDAQIQNMLLLYVKEGELNRTARHDSANAETRRIAEIVVGHKDELKAQREDYQNEICQMREDHLRDAERDREAFMKRSENVTLAIQVQTAEFGKQIADLKNALVTNCKFSPNNAAPSQAGHAR